MQPLDLNLASRPFKNNTLLWVLHGIASTLIVGFAVWSVWSYSVQSQAVSELRLSSSGLETRLGDLRERSRRAEAAIQGIDVEALRLNAEQANSVINRRALSWTRLFNVLEKVVPYEVKMVAIRPVYVGGSRSTAEREIPEGCVPVAVQGLAQNLEAFLELERTLIMDAHFDQVEPRSTDIKQGGEVIFELGFRYFPDGLKKPDQPLNLPALVGDGGQPSTEEAESGGGDTAPQEVSAEPSQPPPVATAPAPRTPPPPRPARQEAIGKINTAPTPEEVEKAKQWKPRLREDPEPPAGNAAAKGKKKP
jgi:hypothetical protein